MPGAPDKQLSGTLSCSEAGEIRLSVLGGFSELGPRDERPYPLILGEVADERKGQQVTLSNCFLTKRTQSSSNPLTNRQEFFAHRGFIGAHLAREADFSFRSANLTLSGLAAWAHDLSGFAREGHAFSVSWKSPGPVSGQIPGGGFTLSATISGSETWRERRLIEHVVLSLTFEEAVREAELQEAVVYPLQNFFTFATDHPNALTKLGVSRQELPAEDISVVGPTTFSDESRAGDIHPFQMLFSLADITDRVEEVFRRWLELSKQYSGAFAVYFGGIYRPPGYTDLHFELMMQVLALYQAGREQKRDGVTATDDLSEQAAKHLPVEVLARLMRVLDSHPLVGAERALTALLREHKAEFSPLVGGHEEALSFVEYVLNTLQYILTRSALDGAFASEGADLYWLTQRLAFLFKIALLKELGFSRDQVQAIVERNRLYKHIRDKIQPHTDWAS